MFKYFKVKPSFPIIKDKKTKNRAGVAPYPQISADQLFLIWSTWTNFIWFEPNNQHLFLSNLNQFDPTWLKVSYNNMTTDYMEACLSLKIS